MVCMVDACGELREDLRFHAVSSANRQTAVSIRTASRLAQSMEVIYRNAESANDDADDDDDYKV